MFHWVVLQPLPTTALDYDEPATNHQSTINQSLSIVIHLDQASIKYRFTINLSNEVGKQYFRVTDDLTWWRVVCDYITVHLMKGGVRLYITWQYTWWRVLRDFTWHDNTVQWRVACNCTLHVMQGGVRLSMTQQYSAMKGGVELGITIQCNEGWCVTLHHTRTPDHALNKIVWAGAPKIVLKDSAGPLWSATGGWTPIQYWLEPCYEYSKRTLAIHSFGLLL